jgi:hypothetical protein
MTPRRKVNTKRRLRAAPVTLKEKEELNALAQRVSYGGNPMHKRNPGDFGLTPPSAPREGKTLCDGVAVFKRSEAEELLRSGVRRGLVSVHSKNGWPKNVWAVVRAMPVEGILENPDTGKYHGYPMLSHDPLYYEVVKRWNAQ